MISHAQMIASGIGLLACSIAAITDLRSRRVPNALTLPLLAAAVPLAALGGVHAALVACAIIVAAFVAGTLVHMMGVLGGGDIKLLAGVSALAGFPASVDVAIYSALCGGCLALVVSLARGELGAVLSRVRYGVATSVAGRNIALASAAIDTTGTRIPYAVAIGVGFAIAVGAATIFPALRIVQ